MVQALEWSLIAGVQLDDPSTTDENEANPILGSTESGVPTLTYFEEDESNELTEIVFTLDTEKTEILGLDVDWTLYQTSQRLDTQVEFTHLESAIV